MPLIRCPYCGFQKDLTDAEMPRGAHATCPKCKHQFPLQRSDGSPRNDPAARLRNPGLATEADSSGEKPATGPETAFSDKSPTTDTGPVTITCPKCDFSSKVPREKVPPRLLNLTCRKCKTRFNIDGEKILHPPVTATDNTPRPKIDHPLLRQRDVAPPMKPRQRALRKIPDLLGDSWQAYKQRILVLIGINLLGALLIGIGAFVLSSGFGNVTDIFGENMVTGILVTLLGALFAGLATTWLSGATVCAIVDNTMGVREALGVGLEKLLSFFWVFSLLGLVIFGGSLFFIVPGLLLATLFLFAQFIVATEESRGMEALLKSREYVQGFFWPVFGRMFILVIFMAILGGILGLIPIIGPLVSLLLWPYTLIVYHEIYTDLRQIKTGLVFTCTQNDKLKWLAIGSAGYLVIPVGIALLIGIGATNSFMTDLLPAVDPFPSTSGQHNNVPPDETQATPTISDSMIYIYAVNYSGHIILNGDTIFSFDGEPNINYNSTQEVRLQPGENELVIDYQPVPSQPFFNLKLKLFQIDWDSGEEISLKVVDLSDGGGRKSYTIRY